MVEVAVIKNLDYCEDDNHDENAFMTTDNIDIVVSKQDYQPYSFFYCYDVESSSQIKP